MPRARGEGSKQHNTCQYKKMRRGGGDDDDERGGRLDIYKRARRGGGGGGGDDDNAGAQSIISHLINTLNSSKKHEVCRGECLSVDVNRSVRPCS